jgi:hypothetical protein
MFPYTSFGPHFGGGLFYFQNNIKVIVANAEEYSDGNE